MTTTEKVLSGLLLVALVVVGLVFYQKTKNSLGIALTEPSFNVSNITAGSVICQSNSANGTGTVITNAQPGRLSFSANNTGLAAVYLCRSTVGCGRTTSTIVISATTSLHMATTYWQTDAYIGGYTCVSDGATTTIGYQEAL